MNAELIEQLDARRYRFLVWQTIGFAAFFGGVVTEPFVRGTTAAIVMEFFTGFGILLFIAATVKVRRNEKCIKKDPAIKAALNNELIKLYGYKSLMWSFYTTLTTSFLLLILSDFWITDMTVRFACTVTVYTACLSLMIARLYYLRK